MPPAMAADLIEESAWLEDVVGQSSLADVQLRPHAFAKYQGVLTKGYSSSVFWLRLRIGPSLEQKLILRIRPVYLDHIELFDTLAPSGSRIRPQLSGDLHPKPGQEYKSLNHGFVIQGSHTARDIYLRLQSTSALMAYAQVLTVDQAATADHEQELFYGVYLGLLAAFMVWALLQWLARREALIAAFLIKQMAVLAHALAHQGYLSLLFGDQLSPSNVNAITSLLVMAYTLFSAAFVLMFLHEFKPVPWLWRLTTGMQITYLPMLVLLLQDEARLAMQINISVGTLTVVGFVLVAVSARAWQDQTVTTPPLLPRSVLIGFASAQLLATLSATLPILNVLAAAEWNLNAALLPGFVNSLLMIVLLSLRTRNGEKQRQHMVLETRLLEQQARTEREQREEQARFLSMLTHELKTPLAVARISLDDSPLAGPQRQRIDRALANINGIIERCMVKDRLEQHKITPRLHVCKLPPLIDECVRACIDPARVKVSERNEAVVHTDSELLAICLANLIDNALKYSPADSPIYVGIQPDQAGVAITVRNTIGPAGVPDAQQVFTKYYRSPSALSKSGSGLGLYLTRHLAKLLGGQVTHRADGEHVEFRLWLPA